jgi:hypothetical protein
MFGGYLALSAVVWVAAGTVVLVTTAFAAWLVFPVRSAPYVIPRVPPTRSHR